ncbi:HPP family protein [bacterium]|nr:MAG: HPP family protein [bacterium]
MEERRRRGGLWGELGLALLPTLTILLVLAFVEAFSRQRLLFASLASSAFLIYLDPRHRTNSVRTLALSQGLAAVLGFAARETLGTGYAAAAVAMLASIVLMVLLDAVHPPAVSTALGFAFRSGPETNLALFGLALTLVALLALLQRGSLWLLGRLGA